MIEHVVPKKFGFFDLKTKRGQRHAVAGEGHTYYQRCLAKGKSHREAIRALKRRISDRVWTHLQADLQHTNPTPSLT